MSDNLCDAGHEIVGAVCSTCHSNLRAEVARLRGENAKLRAALNKAADGLEAAFDRFAFQGQDGPALLAQSNASAARDAAGE